MADYYRRNNDRTKAISYFIKSVNEKPTFVQCYLQIALCYFEMEQYQQALTYLNQYLKINQEDDFAYALRAKIYNFLGDNTSALSEITTAMAIENNEEYKFIECKILYDLKRYLQARDNLKNTKLETAEYYKYLGISEAALGNDADAILNLEKSIILYDDDKIVNMKYNELKLKVESK